MEASEVLNIVLGAGGVAFLYAVGKVVKDYREGSWRRNDTAVADLEKWRRDADDAREWCESQHQWWRSWAGRLEWVILTRLGPNALPKRDEYPVKPDTNRK
jgi:hypothetical protein